MKIIHISDLHLPTKLRVFSLLGKSLIGYLNFHFRRRKLHPIDVIKEIMIHINNSNYDILVISGDITNISHEKEFSEAKKILSPILNKKTFIIPGNHDRYSEKNIHLFEKYFGEFLGEDILDNGYSKIKILEDKIFLGLDSNSPTPIANASGKIDLEILNKSLDILKKNHSSKKIILVCHHPIWNDPRHEESIYHKMTNRDEVVQVLKEKKIHLYLHGHAHTNWVKLEDEKIPFTIINSASSTRLWDKTHETGFHLIELENENIKLKRFAYQKREKKITELPLIQF